MTHRSLEDLETLAYQKTIKDKARQRFLEEHILHASHNGGFVPDHDILDEKLQDYSMRKIVDTCKDLEDRGFLQWIAEGKYGRYVFNKQFFGVQYSDTLDIEERDRK